jgi:hypothetical protein
MGRINRTQRASQGFMLPLVLMISGLLFAAIGAILFSITVQSRTHVHQQARLQSEMNSDAGPQQGLLILSKRLSYLPQRIESGVTTNDGEVKLISETDMVNYAQNSPASFWIDWLNNIQENGAAVATQPDFVLVDSNTAAMALTTGNNRLTIKLIAAFNLGAPLQDPNSAGYNNTTLRYGYEITSQDITPLAGSTVTTAGKIVTIASVLKTDYIDKLIQVHLVRELSRFNLFAINDTMADGTVLYDRTSYSGQVYLENTLYISGSPTYGDTVQISKRASPVFYHETLGTTFAFVKPSGVANPYKVVDPISMPNTSSQDSMKLLTHRMNVGQNPDALTVPNIYVGTSSVAGTTVESSVYVNATDGVDVRVKISQPNSTTNLYQITHGAQTRSVTQDINLLPAFLLFADGRLLIEGTMAEGSKLTLNGANDVIITNDLKYASGAVGADTILGLVSWNGNILVSKSIAPPPGQSIKNLTIHGVLMAVNGAFGAEGYENFATNYPGGYVGTIYHTGAFIRKWNLPTLSNDGARGWGLQTTYDTYLAQSKAPPYFPGNGGYKLIDQNLCAVVEVYAIKK